MRYLIDNKPVPAHLEAGRGVAFIREQAEILGWLHAWDPAAGTFHVLTTTPAPECVAEPWVRLEAPVTSGPKARLPELLRLVIAQFGVETNPRYKRNQQGVDETYCNIFVADVTLALGCSIPQVVAADGQTPARLGDAGARELDANAMITWLHAHGAEYGWLLALKDGAVKAAQSGWAAVVTAYAPRGIGHMAILRPDFPDYILGPEIAQAGARNLERAYVRDERAFRARPVEYWTHA